MQENKISILSTRPLSDSLVKEAVNAGISIDVLSFIETQPVQSIAVQQVIEHSLQLSATVVFTSMNAVEAVAAEKYDHQPHWTIYCIGNTTKQLVKKYFGEESIAGTAGSAAELAELIAEENSTDEVIFFCGDQRREELPAILRKNEIEVTEVVVYQTIAVPHNVEKPYNGILFFSPSAVESFFNKNQVRDQTILFAIGNTTANEIKKYSGNRIIIGNNPGKENLIKQMTEYFS